MTRSEINLSSLVQTPKLSIQRRLVWIAIVRNIRNQQAVHHRLAPNQYIEQRWQPSIFGGVTSQLRQYSETIPARKYGKVLHEGNRNAPVGLSVFCCRGVLCANL